MRVISHNEQDPRDLMREWCHNMGRKNIDVCEDDMT